MIKEKVLILVDIRSTHNVGSIFRTADAININKIYLTGYTPAPIDRFGRKRKDIAKSALGAEENIEWESIENVFELINKLKKENFKIISLEQADNSVNYKNVNIEQDEKVAVLLGNEVEGLSKEILENSDIVAEIPMKGKKESLNVSVATGVLLFSLFDC
jgi:23S rRNA (guanosine2251-2'-O)-methyltransferase